MGSKMLHQAAKFKRNRRNNKRWLAIILCLAVVVSIGTFWVLSKQGEALNHTEKVLECQVSIHQHSNNCYNAEGEAVCGYADYVVHKHNDDCYTDGILVCRLPEVEAHKHTEECYVTEQRLVCEKPEAEGHIHGEGCYDADGVLVCQLPEQEGHQHSEECYVTESRLGCGKLELHTHNENCYKDRNPDGELICDIPVLEEHVHNSDCFRIVTLSGEEVAALVSDAPEASDENENGGGSDSTVEENGAEEENNAAGEEGASEGEDVPEAPVDNGNSNLANFTTGVTIKNSAGDVVVEIDKDGNQKPADAEIYVGENYKVVISFAEIATNDGYRQFEKDENGNLTYQIPTNFECKPVTDYPLRVTGTDEQVGTYSIDANGLLTVHYNEGYIEDSDNVRLDIDFDATVVASKDDKTAEIDFGDNIRIDVELRSDAEIKVEKTAGSYDPTERTISYTVKVDVKKGVVNELQLTDAGFLVDSAGKPLEGDGVSFTLVPGSVAVTNLSGEPLELKDANGDPIDLSALGALENVKIEGEEPFSAGEGILLTYKMKIDDGLYDTAYVSGTAANKVTVTGTTKGEPVKGTDTAKKNFQDTGLRKSGKLVKDDNGQNYIEWTVIVGDGYSDPRGKWLVDTLDGGTMEYYTGLPVKVIPLNKKGKELTAEAAGEEEPQTIVYERPWSNHPALKLSQNKKSFELQLPPAEGEVVPDDCKGFKIVYYTSYTGEPQYSDNEVEIKGTDIHTDGRGIPGIVKEVTKTDSEYVYYEISIDVPAGMKGNAFYLADYLSCEGQYYVENRPVIESVIAEKEDGAIIEFTDGYGDNTYKLLDGSAVEKNNSYNSFYIGFNMEEGKDASETTHWNIDGSSKLKVTYKIPKTAKVGTEWDKKSDKTLGELLNEEKLLWNGVKLVYNAKGDYVESGDSYKQFGNLDKIGQVQNDGTIQYTVVFDNIEDLTIKPILPTNISNFVLIDDFDSRMEWCPDEEGWLIKADIYWRADVNKETIVATYLYGGNADGSQIQSQDLAEYALNADGNQVQDKDLLENASKSGSNKIQAGAENFIYKPGSANDPGLTEATMTSTFPDLDRVLKGAGQNIALVFTYNMKVKDEKLKKAAENGSAEIVLDNTANLQWDTIENGEKKTTTFGPAKETVTYKTGVIEKTSQHLNESDKLDFTIELNSGGYDLAGGNTYKVEDVMSPNLSPIWDTIKIQRYDKTTGEWVLLNTKDDPTYTPDYKNSTLTFTLPDQEHILITYSTRITGDATLPEVSNSATLKGTYDYTDGVKASYKVDRYGSGTSGESFGFTLIKQNSDDKSKLLPGVRFALYTDVEAKKITPPNKVDPEIKYEEDGQEPAILYYCGEYTTGGNGSVGITGLSENVLYALVEVETPVGYRTMSEPKYFRVAANVQDGGNEEDDKNIDVIVNGAPFYIENIPTYFSLPHTGSIGLIQYTLGSIVLIVFGAALTLLYKTNSYRRRKEE